MSKKYHKHRPQSSLLHHKEETQNTNSPGQQEDNYSKATSSLALSQKDNCLTKKDT